MSAHPNNFRDLRIAAQLKLPGHLRAHLATGHFRDLRIAAQLKPDEESARIVDNVISAI